MSTILLVDDSPTMRHMVMAVLRSLPKVSFIEAATGLECIEQLALHPVDLIVLDLNMPDMHGLEVIQFVRQKEAYRRLPILVLTTRGDEESRTAALSGGADAYVTKPFSPQELLDLVQRLLEKADRRGQP